MVIGGEVAMLSASADVFRALGVPARPTPHSCASAKTIVALPP